MKDKFKCTILQKYCKLFIIKNHSGKELKVKRKILLKIFHRFVLILLKD